MMRSMMSMGLSPGASASSLFGGEPISLFSASDVASSRDMVDLFVQSSQARMLSNAFSQWQDSNMPELSGPPGFWNTPFTNAPSNTTLAFLSPQGLWTPTDNNHDGRMDVGDFLDVAA